LGDFKSSSQKEFHPAFGLPSAYRKLPQEGQENKQAQYNAGMFST
jgi:hypothetical protein